MKKFCVIFIVSIFLLQGCSQVSKITKDDFKITNDMTQNEIAVGDSSELFKEKYKNFPRFFSMYVDGVSRSEKLNNIDFTKQLQLQLPCFFVDDKPIDADKFKEDNDIESNLNDYFINSDFCDTHKVEFYSLLFGFSEGKITSIQSDIIDFNEKHNNS